MKTIVFKIDPARPDEAKIREAARIVREGGLVVFPTETVYGIAANTYDEKALNRLREIKRRPDEKKFAVCIYERAQAEALCGDVSPFACRLMNRFWPGPLTLVLPAGAGRTIGLRMPDHGVALEFLKQAGVPLAAPSANVSGETPAVCAEDVLKVLEGRVDAVIDAGKSRIASASTVCEISAGREFKILRAGAVTEQMIRETAKARQILFVCTGNSCRSPMAEGLMKKMLGNDAYITVSSAGVAAFDGMPAAEDAVLVMERQGIDISAHRSKRLTDEMIKEADLILVMEHMHKRAIVDRIPAAEERVFLLKEYGSESGRDPEILDPIGRGIDVYERVLQQLKQAVERVVLKL